MNKSIKEVLFADNGKWAREWWADETYYWTKYIVYDGFVRDDIYLSVSLSTEPIKPITKTIINKLDLREKRLSKINKDLQKLNKKLEQAKKELENLRLFRRRTANGKIHSIK
ncbi:hypothetical protein [Helicobacter pylori]